MLLFKTLFRLVTISLFLGMIFTHSVSALTVDFSVTPSSGPVPLSLTINAGLSVPSSGAVFKSYQWQVSGPKVIQLPGWSIQSFDIDRVGEYTITLILTESALEVDEAKVVNGQTVVETFQVTRTDCATKRIIVYSQGSVPSTPTPVTDKGCQASETRISVGQQVVDSGDSENGGDSGNPIDIITGGGEDNPTTEQLPGNGDDSSNPIDELITGGGQDNPTTEQPPEPVSNFPMLGEASGATFYGGVDNGGLLPNGSSLVSTTEINVTVDLKVAPEHVGQQGDILVAVEYFPVGSELGEFYFKTESTAFPFVRWDLVSAMTPVQSSVTLGDIHNIQVFSGHFQNLSGTYNIYFGYSLQNSAVFVHNYPGFPLTFNVTP